MYALAGEKVSEDPRRTEAYRDLVWDGLKIAPGPTRPDLTEADVAAIREVVRRKAAGFWVEGTTRTTVRKFAHDCIPTGPPVSSQPHCLRGEAAQWVDDRLEEECQRGQLVRGSSAWGSAPFPTKEMPSHKRFRKRRLVVDYRRVNARVKRSTYYCRRGTDALAAAVGSVWYTFVDAVSGFNQIRNTKRAREVLAIVARSGKYLPVGLTFGPVNGPDDFNFVVDRAYAPGRGRRLRFTKEWIAYVDDLTVRSGRVMDGRFYADSEADQAIRDVLKEASRLLSPRALLWKRSASASKARPTSARSMTRPKPIPIIPRGCPFPGVGLGCLGLAGFAGLSGCSWGPSAWSPVMGLEACSYRPYTACARVSVRRSEVQQVRSAREALGSSLFVCFLLGTPEPVCEAPLNPSQGTRVRSRAFAGFRPSPSRPPAFLSPERSLGATGTCFFTRHPWRA